MEPTFTKAASLYQVCHLNANRSSQILRNLYLVGSLSTKISGLVGREDKLAAL